jgi:hypothetical protein
MEWRCDMRSAVSILVSALVCCGIALANVQASGGSGAVLAAEPGGTPPGLAKSGGLPPGLAKKFGPTVPARAYVAIDPRFDDRAWFLIGGRWVLQQGFEPDVRVEVRSLMTLPPIPGPPPVPLPKLEVSLRVVLFE